MDIPYLKNKIRKHYLSRRDKIPPFIRNKLSIAAAEHLKTIAIKNHTSTIHAFIPFRTEIDLTPFLEFCLRQKMTIVTPRVRRKPEMLHLVTSSFTDLKKNQMGIPETSSNVIFTGKYDLILVPGVVFDRLGYRIGYGGGYYDHFLANQPSALKIGVGFPLQFSRSALPHEEHDIPVDYLILGHKKIEITGD